MVFENRVLRRIFEPKRNEITDEWRKLPNEELSFSPNIIRANKSRSLMGETCSTYGRRGEMHKDFGGKT
jgi:hypothetical protein